MLCPGRIPDTSFETNSTNNQLHKPNRVPEGSVAGVSVRYHLVLELVCGSDFSCKLMCRAGPRRSRGVPGSISTENPGKTGPKISSQTAFRYPAKNQHRRLNLGLLNRVGGPVVPSFGRPGNIAVSHRSVFVFLFCACSCLRSAPKSSTSVPEHAHPCKGRAGGPLWAPPGVPPGKSPESCPKLGF